MMRTILLGDVVEIIKGISYRSADYSDSENGIAFVNLKSVARGGGYNPDGIKYYAGQIKPSQYVEPGDILIANTDLTQNREVIGSPIIMPDIGRSACFSLDLSKIIVTDIEVVDHRYLFYYLKSPIAREYMLAHSNGSTVMHLSVKAVPNMEINLPPPDQQKKIANILGSLDEKIELNRRMNKTLEQLGQALFRHYFVDNSEAKSWDEGILGDIMNITMGQSPLGKSYNNNGDGVVFYQGRADFGLRYPNMRLFTTDPKRFAKVGDVLLTVRAPVGDVNQASERCCIGRGLAAISSRMGAVSFCYYYCRQLKADFLEYNSEGTVFGSINSKQLKALKLKIPPIDLVEKFENEVAVIDKTIKLNSHQIKTLITLRDSLLPKLISGEIET